MVDYYCLIEVIVIIILLILKFLQEDKQMIEQESNGKIKVTDTEFKKIVKGYRDRQDKEMNELYQLRKLIEESNGNLQIILPILGGTFGIPAAATKLMTIEEAGLTEE
jgi:predicted RNA methylase